MIIILVTHGIIYAKEGDLTIEPKIVKVRKVGNSTMVTIPKEFSNNCEEYALYKGEDGEIILIPRRPSVFDDPKLKDVDFVQHAEIKGIVGEEDI